jgi:hypothetical protein
VALRRREGAEERGDQDVQTLARDQRAEVSDPERSRDGRRGHGLQGDGVDTVLDNADIRRRYAQTFEEGNRPGGGGEQAVDPAERGSGEVVDSGDDLDRSIGWQPVAQGGREAGRTLGGFHRVAGVLFPVPHLTSRAHQPVVVERQHDADTALLEDVDEAGR